MKLLISSALFYLRSNSLDLHASMEELITYVRGSHIVFGGASMVFGVLALVLRKGSTQHIRSGVLFFWAMFGVFITALYLSYMKTIFYFLWEFLAFTWLSSVSFHSLMFEENRSVTFIKRFIFLRQSFTPECWFLHSFRVVL